MSRRRHHEARGRAGCIEIRRRRDTGREVGVYDVREARHRSRRSYATVCEPHGTVILHDTQRLALAHAREPLEWCDECAAESGREARHV